MKYGKTIILVLLSLAVIATFAWPQAEVYHVLYRDRVETISAVHEFNPAAASPPFSIGTNGFGREVVGLHTDTATQLFSDPTNCAAGSFPLGIDSLGDVESCTVAIGTATQTANLLYGGPTSGAAATPTFRAVVDADIPDTITVTNYLLLTGGTLTGGLTITSTTAGFLPPRMTTTQRDALVAPVAGLTIFNTTTNRGNQYDGTLWIAF